MENLKTVLVNLLKFIGILIGCVVFVTACFVAFAFWYTAQPKPQANAAQPEVSSSAVIACDNVLRLNLNYPETLKLDWTWQVFDRIDNKRIVRGFKAKNAFGAETYTKYRCDVVGETVIKFQIDEQ